MSFMDDFYKRFVKEEYDENGSVVKFALDLKYDYNFAYDVIDEIAKQEPERKAIYWVNEKGDEKILTYKELSQESGRMANMLIAHGVEKGDMVMAVLKRHYEFWILAYALMKIGAVLIPATSQLMKKDYIYRFDLARVKFIVATAEDNVPDHVDQALEEYKWMKEKFIVHGKREGWTDLMQSTHRFKPDLDRVHTRSDENLIAYFSSGTTGYPKLVMHRHAYSAAHIFTAKHWQNIHDGVLHLTVSESGWAKCAWGKMFGQLTCGATEFIYDFDRFVPENVLKVIEHYKVTSLCAPPTMYRFFIEAGLEKYDLSSIKYSCIAGEALSPDTFNKWKQATGLSLMEGFGQTETVVVLCNSCGMTPKPGSMGKPVPLYDIELVDKDLKPVKDGETGEIVIHAEYCKHPAIFKEYYRGAEQTYRAWKGGVYHTGDTAYRDKDGYYWYVGRTDDIIKASGYRIGPFEIESILMEHPSVLECAITAAEHPIRGKVVKATIVLAKDYEPSEELKKELQEFVKKSTAPYKYPRIIEFVDELPKTFSGKIRRVEIRENDEKKSQNTDN